LRHAIEPNRNIAPAHFFLAAALALTGAADDAQSMAQTGLVLDPAYTVRRYRAGVATDNPTYLSQRERICEGMHIAGVPEGRNRRLGALDVREGSIARFGWLRTTSALARTADMP
jgi:hypothetical protein